MTQSFSSSETRCSKLEAELEEEVSTRSRLESELKLPTQQLSRHRLGDDSPYGSSASKAEAAQQELQNIRLASSVETLICLTLFNFIYLVLVFNFTDVFLDMYYFFLIQIPSSFR